MSVRRAPALLVVALVASAAAPAAAQDDEDAATISDQESDRFFADKEGEEDETLFQGSLTSTSFFYRETAGRSDPLPGFDVGAENAADVNRLFTDMRAQLDLEHIKGSDWYARFDGRGRLVGGGRFQSGTFGGNEYELRELYLQRDGDKLDLTFGRQYILDLAATKIDGASMRYSKSGKLTYLAFAGLYPSRISRSVTDDYPEVVPIDDMGNPGEPSRVFPIAGGAGAAYRFDRLYGALGAVGILPFGDDQETGTTERPRIFLTANGYWRQGPKLDVYHYAVVDVEGEGKGLTNLTLGVNFKPVPIMRIQAQINRIDTETLNIIAQERLEDPDIDENPVVQNNVEVQRIASQSARLALSVALMERRFEISTIATVRQRPDIRVEQTDETVVEIGSAQAAEVEFSLLDRRSLADLRLGASYIAIFGIGGNNFNKSRANIFRFTGSREIKDGRGDIEGNLTYLSSEDDDRGITCDSMTFNTCFGSSVVRSFTLGATFFYRLKSDWFGILGANLGLLALKTTQGMMERSEPRVFYTGGFLRIAYRF